MDIDSVNIFRNPVLSAQVLVSLFLRYLAVTLRFVLRHILLIGLLGGLLSAAVIVDGPHSPVTNMQYVRLAEEFGFFAGWWVLLGVASSIGLGTGLHTFVLYLGPHIAKVTLVAYECNYVPAMVPSRWSFESFEDCPNPAAEEISLFTVMMAVQLESFLWGLGTALGELPPYFVARAARLANSQPEEIEELERIDGKSWTDRCKLFLMKSLKQHGFITVLLCASIPNPLFDLAGLLCGHFGIPLHVFLGAAIIGKAFIKVHIQMIFTILLMGAHHMEHLLGFVEQHVPQLSGKLSQTLENHKKLLHNPALHHSEKSLIESAWQVVIIAMISFFIVSMLNSLVREELVLVRQKARESTQRVPKK